MAKILNLKDLKAMRDRCNKVVEPKADTQANKAIRVIIGMATCGIAAGAKDTFFAMQEEVQKQGLSHVLLVRSGCMGSCFAEPTVEIQVSGEAPTLYGHVTADKVSEIVEKHLKKGEKLKHLLVDPSRDKKQIRIALKNCGVIDPENILEYAAKDGYQALGKVLEAKDPQAVIAEIKKSGLRGRGGGGFPTGIKWEACAKVQSDEKYIICNADEGDPGAFMDRSILEGDPHAVLEAMAIAGYAIGANLGAIYIRAEYPLAIQRLQTAILQAKEYGLLGENILGSGFNFEIEIRYGAGAFVCGEETALIHSIEGNRGEPTNKPPFPAEKGLWDKPTNVNNVETLANIPLIILRGADWFNQIGTGKSKGTKVFALAGKVNNVGLVEVPMGTTLREIIFDIGGGIKNGKKFKSVQTGGPSGGCITEANLDTPIDYDNLTRIGSMMGSGGMIVMDEDDCMVNVAKFYLEFTMDESCGKCTACRVGNKRLHETLSKITAGKGTMADVEKLKNLGSIVKDTALCGLGQTSPNPVLSTITHFYDEYVAHVEHKNCPSGVCSALARYTINENCIGCTACARVCPVKCISGSVKKPHVIDQAVCIRCGACMTACKFNAIDRK